MPNKMVLSGALVVLIAGFIPASTPMVKGADKHNTQNLIQRSELDSLPGPVQKFLLHSKLVGTPHIQTVTVYQEGLFKTALDKPWVPFTAVQTYDLEKVSFQWNVKMKLAPLVHVSGSDRLENGEGEMNIKLYGLIPLVKARGPEMDQGAMTRYLSETLWFPQSFLDDHISWEALDSTSAKATLTLGEKSVSGVFHFHQDGRVKEFTCERYAAEGEDFVLRPWRTPIDEYGEMGGLNLGIRGRALWELPEGDFEYVDLTLKKIEFK